MKYADQIRQKTFLVISNRPEIRNLIVSVDKESKLGRLSLLTPDKFNAEEVSFLRNELGFSVELFQNGTRIRW